LDLYRDNFTLFITHLGLDESLFGMYQSPITASFATLSLSVSLLNKKLGKNLLLRIGFILMLIGSVALAMMALLGQENII
jgi:hypothetical protein